MDENGVVVRMEGESVDAYLDRLHEAAAEEGEVNYVHGADEDEFNGIKENFSEMFPGVELKGVTGTPDQILERALVEGRAGQGTADVAGMSAGDIAALVSEDLLTEYRPANEEFIDPNYVFEGKPFIGTGYLSMHTAFNTDNNSAEEMPDDYMGFLEPEWEGRLAVNLQSHEFATGLIVHHGEDYAKEFFEGLAQQDLHLTEGSVTLTTELLAAGEFDVMLDGFGHSLKRFMDEGSPVQALLPQPSPLITSVDMTAVFGDAPHPNAARLLTEFMLTPEGQEVFLNQGKPGVLTEGVEHPYPEMIEGADVVVLMPDAPYELGRELWNQYVVRGGSS